ncbi:Nitric oxide synthase-interacting protein-like protein [Aphelenchoides fujianensis]|nr:Nitric oxide synthase-interacting protein-like protein [Aphelenchoides fujianensis]
MATFSIAEAILQYIVDQKKEQKRLMKAYEAYMAMEAEREAAAANAESDEKRRKFLALELTPAHASTKQSAVAKRKLDDEMAAAGSASKRMKEAEGSLSNMAGEKAQEWKAFWMPEVAPSAAADRVEKPVLNPMSGKPIKFKDLMPVVFTPASQEATTARVHSMEERYKCPVTGDILTNSGRAAYIKPSRCVVSWRALEIIRKEMVDPVTNLHLEESDIIELQRGGTGYAATNQIEAKVKRPNMELT